MKVLNVWSWAASSPLAPGQAIISSDTRGRPDPTPPLPGPRGWKGWERLAVLQARSLRSSFLFDHRPPTSMSPKQGAGAGGTRRWACIPSLQPLFPPNMKKGLIVFNNMLSNLTPSITTSLPSLIRIRITSGAMFCPSLLLNLITSRSRGRERAGFLSTLFAFFLPLAHLICLAAPSILRLH